MVRAHFRASVPSVMAGNSRRNSTAAANSPSRSNTARIAAVDAWIESTLVVIPAEQRRVITTHDAFGYYGARYGVEFLSAEGISTEFEPSAKAIATLDLLSSTARVQTLEHWLYQELSSYDGSLVYSTAAALDAYVGIEGGTVVTRGLNYGTSFEIALKIRELSGAQFEAFSSADLLHGPLAMIDRGEHAEAVRDMTRAHELDPKDAWTLGNRAIAHAWLGHKAEAQADVAGRTRDHPLLVPGDQERLRLARLRGRLHLRARLGRGHRLDRLEIHLGHYLQDMLDLRVKAGHDALRSNLSPGPTLTRRSQPAEPDRIKVRGA